MKKQISNQTIQAIDKLIEILENTKNCKTTVLYDSDVDAIQQHLNIDLLNVTFKKSQVPYFQKGMKKFCIVFDSDTFVYRNGYFPFQIERYHERAKANGLKREF